MNDDQAKQRRDVFTKTVELDGRTIDFKRLDAVPAIPAAVPPDLIARFAPAHRLLAPHQREALRFNPNAYRDIIDHNAYANNRQLRRAVARDFAKRNAR